MVGRTRSWMYLEPGSCGHAEGEYSLVDDDPWPHARAFPRRQRTLSVDNWHCVDGFCCDTPFRKAPWHSNLHMFKY